MPPDKTSTEHHRMKSHLLIAAIGVCSLIAGCGGETANSSRELQRNSAMAMREMRLQMLTTPADELGVPANGDRSVVYGVIMEFSIDDEDTATVVSLVDGNASLYTTVGFGVIGGFAHEDVRAAVTELVQTAESYHNDAIPTVEYPYPAPDRVKFYLLTYGGTTVIDTDLASLEAGTSTYCELFDLGQNVLTELRRTTQLP